MTFGGAHGNTRAEPALWALDRRLLTALRRYRDRNSWNLFPARMPRGADGANSSRVAVEFLDADKAIEAIVAIALPGMVHALAARARLPAVARRR